MYKNIATEFFMNNNAQEKPGPAHLSAMRAITGTLDCNKENESVTGNNITREFSMNNYAQEKPSPAHLSAMKTIAVTLGN